MPPRTARGAASTWRPSRGLRRVGLGPRGIAKSGKAARHLRRVRRRANRGGSSWGTWRGLEPRATGETAHEDRADPAMAGTDAEDRDTSLHSSGPGFARGGGGDVPTATWCRRGRRAEARHRHRKTRTSHLGELGTGRRGRRRKSSSADLVELALGAVDVIAPRRPVTFRCSSYTR